MKCLLVLILAICSFQTMAGDEDWPVALRGVAVGDTKWIEQTPALAAVADVKQAQHLEDAMAAALTTNTVATLKALRIIDAGKWPHMIGSDIICTPPTEASQAEVEVFYKRTRQALLKTVEGAQCLWILEAAWAELQADTMRNIK